MQGEGLVGYWPLRTDFEDASCNGRNGIPQNDAEIVDGVADLSGQGYVRVPAGEGASPWDFGDDNFTLAAWIRLGEAQGGRSVTGFVTTNYADGWWLGGCYPDGFGLYLYRSDTVGRFVHTVFDFGTSWHHVATVRLGETVRLFIDGNPGPSRGPDATGFGGTADLLMGRVFYDNSFMNGNMAEVWVWRRALTDAEIDALVASRPAD